MTVLFRTFRWPHVNLGYLFKEALRRHFKLSSIKAQTPGSLRYLTSPNRSLSLLWLKRFTLRLRIYAAERLRSEALKADLSDTSSCQYTHREGVAEVTGSHFSWSANQKAEVGRLTVCWCTSPFMNMQRAKEKRESSEYQSPLHLHVSLYV